MKDKSFVVIGLGVFGSSIAETLANRGYDVMIIDKDESLVNELASEVTEAYTADITAPHVIEDLGVKNADCVIISTGSSLEAAIITTLRCKELGVSEIVVKAMSETHEKIFKKIGADKVVIPEKDMGAKLAHALTSTNILDIIELSDDYSIVELKVPDQWIGRSIYEINIRKNHGVNIIALVNGDNIDVNPNPNEPFHSGDYIIVVGLTEDILRLEKLNDN